MSDVIILIDKNVSHDINIESGNYDFSLDNTLLLKYVAN